MKTLFPITAIADSNFISSSISFPDATNDGVQWLVGTNYVAGDKVYNETNGVIHRFTAKEASIGVTPAAFPNENSSWLDGGYVNKLAPFQYDRNTQSVGASPYSFEIKPDERFNVVALDNIVGDSVKLEVLNSSGTVIETKESQVLNRVVTDWWTYRYAPFEQTEKVAFQNLPIATTNRYRVTILKSSGDVKLGACIAGLSFFVAELEEETDVTFLNYTTFERDIFGEVKIVVRRSIPKLSPKMLIEQSQIDSVLLLLNKLNGVPTLWLGLEEMGPLFNSTFVIGVYKNLRYRLTNACTIDTTMEIEGI